MNLRRVRAAAGEVNAVRNPQHHIRAGDIDAATESIQCPSRAIVQNIGVGNTVILVTFWHGQGRLPNSHARQCRIGKGESDIIPEMAVLKTLLAGNPGGIADRAIRANLGGLV